MTEHSRLQALHAYAVLDTPPEPQFDDIVRIARILCGTPVALVSLVDRTRQWFKAKVGVDLCETPVEQAVCAHAIKEPEILIIPDLTQDPRTVNNALVTGDPHIRFYAGAVLRTAAGHALGTVCVLDTVPHPEGLNEDQRAALIALARQTMMALEMRRHLQRREDALEAEHENARSALALAQQSEAREQTVTSLLALGDMLRDVSSKTQAIELATATLGETLGVVRAGYGAIDDETGTMNVTRDWTAPGTASLAGRHPLALFPDTVARLRNNNTVTTSDVMNDPSLARDREGYARIGMRAQIVHPLRARGRLESTLFVHNAEARNWTQEDASFVRAVGDRLHAALAKLEAEEEQHVLNMELSHRLKNTLTMVQAIAAQTLRNSADKDGVRQFNQRIQALSTAHNVLLDQNWAAAHIVPIVTQILSLHADLATFRLTGPNLAVGPKMALSLSLLLHELATNALKYGALSVPGGHVKVAWAQEGSVDVPLLTLVWEEQDGPAVTKPEKAGFGSRIINMGLSGTGKVQMDYLPSGVIARFEAPFSAVGEA
jgi:two-component sensor histidine kinase